MGVQAVRLDSIRKKRKRGRSYSLTRRNSGGKCGDWVDGWMKVVDRCPKMDRLTWLSRPLTFPEKIV